MRIQRVLTPKPVENYPVPDLSVIDPIIAQYKGKPGNVIPILQKTQEALGFLPEAAFKKISAETGLAMSYMYGVATFYAQFRLKPAGKNIIKVCHGTACHVQNADAVTTALAEALEITDGETTPDGFFTLESVACLGCCSLAPVMMIGTETYGKLDGKQAVNIIKDIRLKQNNQ